MTGGLQDLSNSVYRLAARVSAGLVCRGEIVESVYSHRSVATGEVSFGRSDIDLLAVVREPDPASGDGPEQAALYERVRLLRRLNPALGQMRLYDAAHLEQWARTDTYKASHERRTVRLLAGKPAPIPPRPVLRDHAVRWFAYWPEHFFSAAVRERNRRNLRKMAGEMWNAFSVARGFIPEPYLTRREAEDRARDSSEGAGMAEVLRDPHHASHFAMQLARRLHDELLPPLGRLSAPLVFRAPLPPRSRERVFVIVPDPNSALPAEVFEPRSFLASPELLHLYIHYVNPFLDWFLPPELRSLGLLKPSPREYADGCRFYAEHNMLRHPGFLYRDTWTPGVAVGLLEYCLEFLCRDESPEPMPDETLRMLLGHQPTVRDFYRHDFPGLYRRCDAAWKRLNGLEA